MVRRSTREKPNTYNIETGINAMERAVIAQLVSFDYTAWDFIEWVLPRHEIDALANASQYTPDGKFGTWYVYFPLDDGTTCHVQMNVQELGLLRPHDRSMLANKNSMQKPLEFQSTPAGARIKEALEVGHQIKKEHDTIREIAAWMTNHSVTPGWARHYAPWLGNFLSKDHKFHQVDGRLYKDIALPHDTAQKMRRAGEIVTRGLLAGSGETGAITVGDVFFANGQKLPWFKKT